MDNFDLRKYLAEGKLRENTESLSFGFWFREGRKSKEQVAKAIEILDKHGIDYDHKPGTYRFDFPSYEGKKQVKDLLVANGADNFIIYNFEND